MDKSQNYRLNNSHCLLDKNLVLMIKEVKEEVSKKTSLSESKVYTLNTGDKVLYQVYCDV